MLKRFLSFLTLILVLIKPVVPCRMLGVIALPGNSLSTRDSLALLNPFLLAEIEEFRLQGGSGDWPYNNRDGWAIVSYTSSAGGSQVLSFRSALEAFGDESFYSQTNQLLAPPEISILMGHLRQTSSGAADIVNPHPFLFTDLAGRCFSFAHNGDLDKEVLRELIGENWLDDHPPQTYGSGPWNESGWSSVVDSELFFFWIMKNIEGSLSDEAGIQTALLVLEEQLPGSVKNFLLSDGYNLYAYRSSTQTDIQYFDGSGEADPPWYIQQSNHRAVMSTPPPTGMLSDIPWIQLGNRSLLILKSDGTSEVFDLADPSAIHSTEAAPHSFQTIQAFPNPFNSTTVIPFRSGQPDLTRLTIYNILGRAVYSDSRATTTPGSYQFIWNGLRTGGEALPSGYYFFRITNTRHTFSGKLLLLK